MPWKTDGQGEKSYELSLFAKEELPTWEELYKDFWLEKAFVYDPNDVSHQKEDLYWKRPYRKLLMAWGCNQLNKLIDENRKEFYDWIKKASMSVHAKLFFALVNTPTDQSQINSLTIQTRGKLPPIYTSKLPSTGEWSIFITNNHPRIDIDDLDGELQLAIIIHNDSPHNNGLASFSVDDAIEFLIQPIIAYFINGIGWKNETGELIPYERVSYCTGVGADPAL